MSSAAVRGDGAAPAASFAFASARPLSYPLSCSFTACTQWFLLEEAAACERHSNWQQPEPGVPSREAYAWLLCAIRQAHHNAGLHMLLRF